MKHLIESANSGDITALSSLVRTSFRQGRAWQPYANPESFILFESWGNGWGNGNGNGYGTGDGNYSKGYGLDDGDGYGRGRGNGLRNGNGWGDGRGNEPQQTP